MKIFITGVTGYVGRNLAQYFIRDNDVGGLARDPDKAQALAEMGISIVEGDLCKGDLDQQLIGYDVLIHAAADTDHRNMSKNQYETNVRGTKLLIQAAKAAGVKTFVHISTESVLLTGCELYAATEDMPYPQKPVGNYSDSKRLAEELALHASDNAFSVVVIRPRFVWGRDDTTAAPQILKAIDDKQFAWINGGTYKTSTTHIGNLCIGVESAIANGRAGEIYFISDDDDREFREVISSLADAYGRSIPTKSVPRVVLRLIAKADNIRRKLTAQSRAFPITMQEFATSAVGVTLDITKAKAELGYKPAISFQQGIQEIKQQNNY